MKDELRIISAGLLTEVSEKEVNALVNQMVEKSRENMDEICELTLECTALLSSAESRSSALSNQGVFKRLVGNVTGKNQRLQNAILKDNTNALYAAQGVINRVMLECTNNRKLMLAINDRISDVYVELKENQNDIAAGVLMVRQAIVAFYKQYKEELSVQNTRISKMEEYAKVRCPECQKEILTWQRVCPSCGYIHPLKRDTSSESTIEAIKKISEIVKDDTLSEDIIWSITAQKTDRVLKKVKLLAELGHLPGYTEEISGDIEKLILKCKNAEFQIAIVGVMKAGKSYLMNALMGAEIASVEVNPETATLTKFRSTDGFYINIKFHDKKQWMKLKDSARISKQVGKSSLRAKLEDPSVIKMENEWVGHEDLFIKCKNLLDLKKIVKKYTSSQTDEHLFVSEVEVGIDRHIFNMPAEVVFVDTPGLKDPVKYRSDITRDYIKKADAVLIAVPTAALTDEGNEIITTVLDCTDAKKAYIVATQKDLKDKDEDCEKIVSLWVKQLIEAKRYTNERTVRNRIILTSAKMDILMRRWLSLSDEERENPQMFSDNEYSALESYVKRVVDSRRYDINRLSYDKESRALLEINAGINALRGKLENNLIEKYRELKIADIQGLYIRCKKQMMNICKKDLTEQEKQIDLAVQGAEALRKQIINMSIEKKSLQDESDEIKREADKLKNEIFRAIESLERKGAK
ncbi:dynamin family protein [Lachnospiraceae bacterium LCP25S3_G4]